MLKTRSVKTAGTAASEIQHLMFPFSNGPDDALQELCSQVSNCCHERNRLRAFLFPADSKDGKYTTSVSLGTPAPTFLSKRDPFRPSSHKHQTNKKKKDQDEDSTAHCLGSETQA